MGDYVFWKRNRGTGGRCRPPRHHDIRAVAVVFLVLMFVASFGGMVAEAARTTETYECPHGGFTEWENTGEHYYPSIHLGTFLTGSGYTTVFRDDFYGYGIPSAGDTMEKDSIYGKEIPRTGFAYHYACCPACGAVYRAADSSGGGYVATLFVTNSNRYNATKVIHAEELEGYYFMKLSYSSTAGQYVVDEVLPLREYAASKGIAMDTGLAGTAHSYRTVHNCNTGHKERLHVHTERFDDTEYEYECDCTETHKYYSSSTTSASESGCGHMEEHYYAEYRCRACGELLYSEWHEGCNASGCDFYKKKEGNFGYDYYAPLGEGRSEGSHPGKHSYRAKGERITCTNSSYVRQGDSDFWEGICDKCGVAICYYDNAKYGGYKVSPTVGSYHYYYVEPTLPDSCYAFGEIHSGATKINSTTSKYDCYFGESGHHLATQTEKCYDCRTCGLTIYVNDSDTCGYGHNESSSDTYISIGGSSLIGAVGYWFGEDYDKINTKALHRLRTLTCTESEYGEIICGKVVTALTPVEKEQKIGSGEPPYAKAYARFLDGHVEEVECAVSGLDADLYNEWQEVTLSYGEFSSVSSREPQTTQIRVYIERMDFDLTLMLEGEGMGTLSGMGTYTAGTKATAAVEPASGYAFLGWYDGDTEMSGDMEYSFMMPAKDLTLTARFEANSYLLTVSSESPAKGTASGGGTAAYKTPVTVTAAPKPGFTFLGWYDGAKKVSGDASYAFTMPAYSLKLTAKFVGREMTVSFDPDGGSACAAIKANYLSGYGRLPSPERNGYTFLGWTYGGEYVTETSPVTVEADHTLTATWAENGPEFFMVSYGDAYKDNSYGKLPSPSKRGYGFLNWFLTENSYGNGDSLGTSSNTILAGTKVQVAGNHWLHAGWKERQFTVSFEPNGGSTCGSITVAYDRKYGFFSPLPVPVRDGYTFTGWYVSNVGGNGDGTQITNESRVQILSAQTLYAGWTQDAVEVQVRFEPRTQGQVGLSPEESRLLGFGSTIGCLASGTAERTVTYPGTYGGYAMSWCSCTEDAHAMLPQFGGRHYSIDYDSSYIELPAATRVGYTFKGWTYGDAAVTDRTGTLAAANHTVFATYTPNTYVVALDGRGATKQEQVSATMTFDAALPKVKTPEKTGYTFHGYFTGTHGSGTQYYDADGNGMREWLEDSIGVTELYAYWTQDELVFPEEIPLPSVTPGAADSVSAVFSATEPHVAISSESYSVEKAIPSTEQVMLSASVGKYSFAGSLSKITGVDTLRIYVTVSYRTQHEKPDETLEISGVKTKTYAVEVPRAYSYWAVGSADMYVPTGVTVQNNSLEDGTAAVIAGSPMVPYELVKYTADQHIQSPGGYDADGMKTISITCGQTFYVITDTGKAPTEEELAATIGVHAKNFAYQDGTQLKVRSDALMVDGKSVLSDAVLSSGNGEECDRQAIAYLTANVPLINISGTAELNQLAKNGKYPSAATVQYEAYPIGTAGSPKKLSIPTNDIVILTPVVIHPTGDTLRHTAMNEDGTYDEDFSITVDEYAEFLTMDLSDVMTGAHVSQKGYGTGNYMATASGKRPFDSILLRSETDLYIDINKDTTVSQTTIGGSGDDLHFPKGAVLQFLTDGSSWYVVDTEGSKVPVDIAGIRLYVLAKDCTGNFGITYGALALNGRFTMAHYHYDYESLFTSLRPSNVCLEGANRLFDSYFAYKDVEYEVHYKYITFHWYGAEEKVAQPTEDVVVTKQGYEAYFYATQVGGFDGTIEVTPTFSVVDKEGNLIDDDILVMYYDYRPGLLGDMRRFYGITPADDDTEKDFLATWLGAGITEPEVSQLWTYDKVTVNQHSMAERTVLGTQMEALHGSYRLPNGITVLRKSDITDLPLWTREQFLSSWKVRDDVIQSDTMLPYVTEGYLKVDLDLSAIYSDGSILLAHGSIPPITLYYVLGDTTDTGLYYQYNGRIPRGDGKDDDYEVDHISTGRLPYRD